MTSPTSPGTDVDTPIVGPGERKLFTYLGEQIPNQVFVQNESGTEQANFVMQAVNGPDSQWRLFDILRPGETRSYMVEWPVKAIFANQGLFQTSIKVYGNGIFAGEQGRDS